MLSKIFLCLRALELKRKFINGFKFKLKEWKPTLCQEEGTKDTSWLKFKR